MARSSGGRAEPSGSLSVSASGQTGSVALGSVCVCTLHSAPSTKNGAPPSPWSSVKTTDGSETPLPAFRSTSGTSLARMAWRRRSAAGSRYGMSAFATVGRKSSVPCALYAPSSPTPCLSSRRAMSGRPCRVEESSGSGAAAAPPPGESAAAAVAPFSSSTLTTGSSPFAHAMASGDGPLAPAGGLADAPAFRSSDTTSVCRLRQASASGVLPPSVVRACDARPRSGSSSSFTILVCPLQLAMCSAAMPETASL